MDLRDKLNQLNLAGETVPPKKPEKRLPLQTWIDGQERTGIGGVCFQLIKQYPRHFVHGHAALADIRSITPSIFEQVSRDAACREFDIKKALFIDTETTGLAGGTGTVPFMIGLGYLNEAGFCVEQLFMRDFHEEKAVLQRVADLLNQYAFLVSYNGKGYDLNLLQSRFLMHRMRVNTDHPHLDLLYPIRRIYRRRLQDCSLSNIEGRILGFMRQGDIPGFMIPDLYFRYVRTGKGHELKQVFEHNQWDIVSLLALLIHLGRVHGDPGQWLNHSADLLSHGRSLFLSEAFEAALPPLLAAADDAGLQEESLTVAVACYKKMARWQDAVRLWQELAEKFPHHLDAFEELAKYYEHREKNIDAALSVVEKVLQRLRILSELHSQAGILSRQAAFDHRHQRLIRKKQKLHLS